MSHQQHTAISKEFWVWLAADGVTVGREIAARHIKMRLFSFLKFHAGTQMMGVTTRWSHWREAYVVICLYYPAALDITAMHVSNFQERSQCLMYNGQYR
jgi:hypothetical protein